MRVLLNEVTCVMVTDSQDLPTMAIYTAKRVLERKPIKLRFKTDNELHEWVGAHYIISKICDFVAECLSDDVTGFQLILNQIEKLGTVL